MDERLRTQIDATLAKIAEERNNIRFFHVTVDVSGSILTRLIVSHDSDPRDNMPISRALALCEKSIDTLMDKYKILLTKEMLQAFSEMEARGEMPDIPVVPGEKIKELLDTIIKNTK